MDFLILLSNSAWNQRYFCLHNSGFSSDALEYELLFVMNRLKLLKNNESAWNYLRGLLQILDAEQCLKCVEYTESLFEEGHNYNHILAFLTDAYIELCQKTKLDPQITSVYHKKAIDIFLLLETKYDTIRKSYWKFRREYLACKIDKNDESQIN